MNNKNYLVIGGSKGIGLETVRQLTQAGANVWVAARHLTDELADLGVSFQAIDVTQPFVLSNLPAVLHGVVYCPGSINLKPFNRLSEQDFMSDIQVNVLGAVRTLQQTFTALKAAKGSSVVLYSTVAVRMGMGFHASVAVAKSAVEGLAKSLAAEWVGYQIRVNAIAPSLTDTPLAAALLSSTEKREAASKRHPLGRIGTTADIAGVSVFLLSDAASWLTGQILSVDGGMSSIKLL